MCRGAGGTGVYARFGARARAAWVRRRPFAAATVKDHMLGDRDMDGHIEAGLESVNALAVPAGLNAFAARMA